MRKMASKRSVTSIVSNIALKKTGARAQPLLRGADQLTGRFDDGEIGVARGEHLGDVAQIAAHLERPAGRQERIERAHHVAGAGRASNS